MGAADQRLLQQRIACASTTLSAYTINGQCAICWSLWAKPANLYRIKWAYHHCAKQANSGLEGHWQEWQHLLLGYAEQQEGTRAASGQDASTSGQARAPETQELPYTIAAPESYEEFASLVAGRSAADLSAAIQRIVACNSAALATANRRKLQVRAACGASHCGGLSMLVSGSPTRSSPAGVLCIEAQTWGESCLSCKMMLYTAHPSQSTPNSSRNIAGGRWHSAECDPGYSEGLLSVQVLYGILVQHFANLARQAPLPIAHLEALTKQLLDLTAEVPFYAATVARARLSRLQQRLDSALSDPVSHPAFIPLTCCTCLQQISNISHSKQGPPPPPQYLLTGC